MAEDVGSVLRDNAFVEIDRVARIGESYMRSLAEAAYRGNELETLVHLKEVRACVIHMGKAYREWLDGQGGGAE